MNDETALRMLHTANKTTTENLCTLAYKIEGKWGNQLGKTELRFEGEKELICV